MKIFACAVLLSVAVSPALACEPALLPALADVKQVAECVKSHELRIASQRQDLDRWMALHEKLAALVYRQQEEIGKLKDEVFDLKTKLATQQKKR